MKSRSGRRDFLISSVQSLGVLGLGSGTITNFLSAIYTRTLNKASGADLALNPDGFRYIFISLNGAPPRWLFDFLATPNGPTADTYVPGGFGTAIKVAESAKKATDIQLVHETYAHTTKAGKVLHLPPVWGMSPTEAHFPSLLEHALFVRGMDMEINSHAISNARQVAPIIGGASLHGVIADQLGSPISAVICDGANSGTVFQSNRGLGSVIAPSAPNPIEELLKSFSSLPSSISFRRDETKAVVDQFLDRMDSYARERRISESTLRDSQESADLLIRMGVDTLSQQWDGLFNKYQTMIHNAMNPSKGDLPGFFDTKIPCITGDVRLGYQTDTTDGQAFELEDLRNFINPESHGKSDSLARQFALTEFLMTSGICSVVDLSVGQSVYSDAHITDSDTGSIGCDQHGIGSLPSTLTTTVYYRGLLTGMTEIVKVLKNKNLFSKTILHVSGEFNREPQKDGAASGHGVDGSCATLISGMFTDTHYIGNIVAAGNTKPGSQSPGTWGVSAPWEFEDGIQRPIRVNDIARSITAMTNSEDIVANGYSLVAPVGDGTWIPKKSGGTNV